MNRYIKSVSIFLLILFMGLSIALESADECYLKQVEQWKLEDGPFGDYLFSMVTKDNSIVCLFSRVSPRSFSNKKAVAFAPFGQGPGDLSNFSTCFPYRDDIAIVESSQRLKVFKKVGEKFEWKATKHLKLTKYPQFVRGGTFADNKFFIAGMTLLNAQDPTAKTLKFSYMRIYDDDGKLLKTLFENEIDELHRYHEIKCPMAAYKNEQVFFLKENLLEVIPIDTKTLEPSAAVNLEKPSFYKAMPEGYYKYKLNINGNNVAGLMAKIQEWSTSYSAITKVAVDGDDLIIQIRTANDQMKRFAILFYKIPDSFKLEKTVFTEDLLLGVKNGKFYCYAKGDPGKDDEAEDCHINVYQLEKKKEENQKEK